MNRSDFYNEYLRKFNHDINTGYTRAKKECLKKQYIKNVETYEIRDIKNILAGNAIRMKNDEKLLKLCKEILKRELDMRKNR